MSHIITTTHLQQKIGSISESITHQTYIVTNHGEGRMVLLPYFEGCDEEVADYLEDYEMWKNRKTLQDRYQKSSKSGKSSLVI